MGQVSLLNVEYTAPLSLIPGLGVDKAHRVIDRDLVASSKWITAKLARWSGDDVSTTPQLEVMGDGKSVSIYVAVHHGKTPSAKLSELFDACKLADFLINEHAENAIMKSVNMLGSDRGSIDGNDVDYVIEYMPTSLSGILCEVLHGLRDEKRATGRPSGSSAGGGVSLSFCHFAKPSNKGLIVSSIFSCTNYLPELMC
ncbi:hypothetical protein KC340_g3607 [Hortaea werneckii]|nr:hypothetical protein KC339_g5941 [Hortaea werneckii]KAI7243771.1 hypothetical protein KC365_g2008 [Hortaea werneckii]KAI7331895.1 hypothetical protein KC340_g3607 [Hortaea werneckii]KAI7405481.1 hypothetical protein KC328_g1389 [Hortaea werneckii]KAI7475030.1 hypothetical protein KC357_g5022 [Hortaea werneckii]